jgi:putative tricarboxylic transport membrane protein
MVGLIFVNIFMFLQGKFLTRFFAKLALVPVELMTPLIVILCLTGAYSINNSLFDVYVSVVTGLVAYVLIRFGYSVIPVLLGYVLGPLIESNLRRSLLISQGDLSIFLRRPISLIFIVVMLLSLVLISRKKRELPGDS